MNINESLEIIRKEISSSPPSEATAEVVVESIENRGDIETVEEKEEKEKSNKVYSPLEQRALKLLGSGQNQEITAKTLGVSPSRISQLMSDTDFAQEVQNLRFKASQKHSKIDERYDTIEETLQKKLLKRAETMYKTGDILKALQLANSAKRKTVAEPESINSGNRVITLVMPVQVVNKFIQSSSSSSQENSDSATISNDNQILEIDGQSLITVPSEKLNDLAANSSRERAKEEKRDQLKISDSGQRVSKADLE